MLFRPKPYLWDLERISLEEVLSIADKIAHDEVVVRPIYECIKVYARLTQGGEMTYARHRYDLGARVISAREISSRIKSEARSSAVFNALKEVEDIAKEEWPFHAGSSSWCLLEILHPEIRIAGPENQPAIIFREAHRIDHKGRKTSSKLLKRMFSTFCENVEATPRDSYFTVVFDPQINLVNTSGTGAFTMLKESILEDPLNFEHALRCFSLEVISENFDIEPKNFPGINVAIAGSSFRVSSDAYIENKQQLNRKNTEAKDAKGPNYPPLLPGRF
tara:strand:+ start:1318 stop:2145 length:828 start_codon:yes stop_codon:yes gene_type:complete